MPNTRVHTPLSGEPKSNQRDQPPNARYSIIRCYTALHTSILAIRTESSFPDGLAHGEAGQVPPLSGEARPPAGLGERRVEAFFLGGAVGGGSGRARLCSLLLLRLRALFVHT